MPPGALPTHDTRIRIHNPCNPMSLHELQDPLREARILSEITASQGVDRETVRFANKEDRHG